MGKRREGFTLVELLVVVAVLVVLLAILVPTLGRAREQGRVAVCLSNLRQLALAANSYQNDYKGWFPSPVTTVSEKSGWYTGLDPYMSALHPDDSSRAGVAGERAYRKSKECAVWPSFAMDPAKPPVNTNQTIREFSRTIKMNTHLRRVGNYFARFDDVARPVGFVLFGDGTAIDLIPWPTNTYETGQFSMDVNDPKEAGVGIRHNGAANVALADGHAESEKFPAYSRKVGTTTLMVFAWQSEFTNAAGTPVYGSAINGTKTAESQGLRRNPAMPLVWSEPGRLYRP